MIRTKEDLLKDLELSIKTVTLKSGKQICVSEIGASDYMRMCELCASDDGADQNGNLKVDMRKFNAGIIAFSLVDPLGNRLFEDSDIPLLENKARPLITEMADIAKRVNGLFSEEGNESEPTEGGSTTGE